MFTILEFWDGKRVLTSISLAEVEEMVDGVSTKIVDTVNNLVDANKLLKPT